MGAHHQNGIVKNKNKIMTTGERTLLLTGIKMYPQMIYEMFWPFDLKAIVEDLKSL